VPEIEVVDKQTVWIRNPKGEMEPRTLIGFRREDGAIDAIVFEIADPKPEDIVKAIKERAAEAAKFKPFKVKV